MEVIVYDQVIFRNTFHKIVDVLKLLNERRYLSPIVNHRRVIPSGVEDIGTWMSILQLTSNIAVLTNAGIICFTMNILSIDGVGVLWVFIGFQYFIFLAMNFFEVLIVDVPEEV